MSQHALLSASSANRWLHCTPSARLEELLPDTESEHARRGTLAHAIAELKLRKYCTVMKASAYKASLKQYEKDPLYEPEMASNTDMYLDYIKGVITGYPKDTKPNVYIEHRIRYDHIAPEGFGTADCIVIGGNDLHIIDYKNGRGVKVEAEENPQMKLYALGALREFGLLYDIQFVHLTIVQPNLGGLDSWTTPVDALYTWADEIRPIAQAAYNGDGECVTGSWCKFCKAFVNCPAQRKDFSMFSDLTDQDVSSLSFDEIGNLLARIPAVAEWMDKMREYALEQIISGKAIPGWKSVEGQSRRAWANQEMAFKALIDGGVNEAILYKREPLTLAAVEKEIGKKQFDELAAAFVTRPAGAPTLAPETDKRPAFTGRTPEQVFQKVEESLL